MIFIFNRDAPSNQTSRSKVSITVSETGSEQHQTDIEEIQQTIKKIVNLDRLRGNFPKSGGLGQFSRLVLFRCLRRLPSRRLLPPIRLIGLTAFSACNANNLTDLYLRTDCSLGMNSTDDRSALAACYTSTFAKSFLGGNCCRCKLSREQARVRHSAVGNVN